MKIAGDLSRRRVLAALALMGASVLARAQPRRAPPRDGKYRVVLRWIWPAQYEATIQPPITQVLSRALAGLGFTEGVNLDLIAQHLPDATPETRAKWLAELATSRVDAVVVVGAPDARRVRALGGTIPIVAWDISDPVALGLAKNFVRPGGNVTGLTYGLREVLVKHVHFLQRLAPNLEGIAFVGGPKRHDNLLAEAAVAGAGLKFILLETFQDFEAVLPTLRQRGVQAVTTAGVGLRDKELARLAIRGRIASIGVFDTDAEAGMLASYGEHYFDLAQRIAQVVATLLRGASPAETPFVEPQRFRFTLNRSTARALGVEIPPDLMILADHVYGE